MPRKDRTIQDRVRYAQVRLWINELKERPCVDCGRSYPTYVMDFDHVRGKKRFNMHIAAYYKIATILEEIAKCVLVCANCHRIRTFKESQ